MEVKIDLKTKATAAALTRKSDPKNLHFDDGLEVINSVVDENQEIGKDGEVLVYKFWGYFIWS